MDRKGKIRDAINKSFNQGKTVSTRQIIDAVQKHYSEIPESSILPGDFCNNHANLDPFSGKYHIFSKSGHGKYTIL